MTAIERLIAHIKTHEGFRAFVYDDATGQPIRPGTLVRGNPTIGYGWALNLTPMHQSLADVVLREMAQERIFDLHHRLPWMNDLDDVRKVALYELAYNLGVDGLLGFEKTIELLRRRKYALAGVELLDSDAARQLPGRYHVLSDMLITGRWPGEGA